ncbi:putative phage tail protein [Neoroseomonas lacus]|uniref:DUF2313 domain-containing protein n=1 Tax=Neoroseomonas lacus TaxID=287609 RepID=A0A917NNL2_9PROT|nr:putative phage tail protein [Neoroseomonas lacus]GGJ14301.1 hypothetical protein GCM10011320_21920 [Neoroseomonas lacus]
MTIAGLGEDDFLAGLQALLPRGAAWPRDPEALLTKLLSAIAAGQARQHERTADLSEVESDPALTDEMLEDWERAYGLPDLCNPAVTDKAARRSVLLAKIIEGRTPTLPTIAQIIAGYGVTASITEHRPHTCEDHCEYPLYDQPWAFAWSIYSPIGQGLSYACAVQRIAPAHTVPIFAPYRWLWSLFNGLQVGATLRRPGSAPYHDYRGQLQSAAADVARFDYNPALPYNIIPNPWADGTGAPTPPDGWSVAAGSGITPVYLSSGVRDGIPYTRWRLQGTSSGGGFPIIHFQPFDSASAPTGTDVCGTIHFEIARLGGTHSVVDFRHRCTGVNAGGTVTGNYSTTIADAAVRTFGSGPFVQARNMAAADIVFARAGIMSGNAAGRVFDIDIDIGFPTLRVGSLTPLTTTVPIADLVERINNIPQHGLIGLLVEPGESEQLTFAMPDGTYDMLVRAGTVNVAGTFYEATAYAAGGFGLTFVWPAAAVTAGERHVQTFRLTKVA